jgi:hypothetical protein
LQADAIAVDKDEAEPFARSRIMNKQSAGATCTSRMVEKIGVRRITVEHPELHAMAVVGSFFAVDALLMGWSARLNGVLDCRFVIEYHDGCTIRGAYRFKRQGGKRPGLMHFVRASAQTLGETKDCVVTGLAHPALDFLDVYETEDFALA